MLMKISPVQAQILKLLSSADLTLKALAIRTGFAESSIRKHLKQISDLLRFRYDFESQGILYSLIPVNVCTKIECPFRSQEGCKRYNNSAQCHLILQEFDFQLMARSGWLFIKHSEASKLQQLKHLNRTFLDGDVRSQKYFAKKVAS
jgi:hypothetical protein